MESLSTVLSSSPPIQNHLKTLKSKLNSLHIHFPPPKNSSLQNHLSSLRFKTSLSWTAVQLFTSLPCLASEALTTQPDQVSNKISLESVLVAIDDFNTRNPFFVFGCAFVWLVVLPLTEEYLRKYKFVPAIDAFRKLQENPDAQLLDIRDKRTIGVLGSPNLKILDKSAVQVEFSEGNEDEFVKNVLQTFKDPASTVLCIMDDFDGNSLKAAELLFKNGFKEAYAIKGGVRGKAGWLDIQENLIPTSAHMLPRKKKKKAMVSELGINGGVTQINENRSDNSSSSGTTTDESQGVDNGHVNLSMESSSCLKFDSRSPYPCYPDLKPPSSPTPSKP